VAKDEGMIRTEDGVGLHYVVVGPGAPSVLVPNGFYLEEDLGTFLEGRAVVYYDARNRGRSEAVQERSRLRAGVENDVSDLEAVRRHFAIGRAVTLGHSYMGLVVAIHALRCADALEGVIQIGPMGPFPGRAYPPDLAWSDDVSNEVFRRLGALQKERGAYEPSAFCEEAWRILRPLYVTDPANASRIRWDRCHLPNELGALAYWNELLFPSIQSLVIDKAAFRRVDVPVLTIHGRLDRSAPFGGGRDWAELFPNGHLLVVEGGPHAPWVEKPELVGEAIRHVLARGRP
jgi:proline iminopeptidase